MMKKNTKLIYIILACICVGIAAVILCYDLWYRSSNPYDDGALDQLREQIKNYDTTAPKTEDPYNDNTTAPDETESVSVGTDDVNIDETTGEPFGDTLPAAMDFDNLWEINPEICCWLTIPGTEIDYPVLQSPDNDKKYLSTAYDGRRYISGSLFTEATYNNKDFNDPVTVIYGHTMRSEILFGTLQETYSSETAFNDLSNVRIYLPGEARDYTVFAAVPYSDIHLLNTYDFSEPYWYNRFFEDVFEIREIGANFHEDIRPEVGDRVIVLSVCFRDDGSRRYLVMAINNTDLADNGAESEQ